MHSTLGKRRSASFLPSVISAICLALPCVTQAGTEADPLEVGGARVVVAPLNLGIAAADEISSGLQPVTRQLLLHLKEAGHRVAALESDSARKLWQEVLLEARADDPEIGVHAVYERFAARVAEQVDYGVMVFPSLVVRAARVHGERASWDGVNRWVKVPRLDDSVDTNRQGEMRIYSYGGTGELAAASLHVAVFESGGGMRFEGAGGLSLLHEVTLAAENKSFSVADRENAFGDAEELREGISTAFTRTLVAPPAALPN